MYKLSLEFLSASANLCTTGSINIKIYNSRSNDVKTITKSKFRKGYNLEDITELTQSALERELLIYTSLVSTDNGKVYLGKDEEVVVTNSIKLN